MFTNRGSNLVYEEKIEGGSIPIFNITDVKDGDFLELDMNQNFTPIEHQRKLDFKGYSNKCFY